MSDPEMTATSFDRFADRVGELGLSEPALLFVLSHRPLARIFGELAGLVEPFWHGQPEIEAIVSLARHGDGVDQMAAALCRRSEGRIGGSQR